MANTPIILSARTLVGDLEMFVDGFINPRHELPSAIGSEPLEDGSQVTDHVTNLPRQLTVTGIVSDFGGGDRPRLALEQLETIREAKEPVSVITEWMFYEEVLIRRVTAVPSGRGMRLSLELQEIVRASAPIILPAAAASSRSPPGAPPRRASLWDSANSANQPAGRPGGGGA